MKKSLLKKTLGVMLGSVICISMLAGCGGGEKKAEKPASKFPEKAITVVVPWNPGGTNDLMARALQPVFKSKFKADLVVKNSPGGGSAVGITEVIKARPDGYTVGLASSSYLALLAQGKAETGVDKITNICLVAEEPIVLVVKEGGKFADAKAFLAAAKSNPGKISIGVPGAKNINEAYATILGKAASTQFNFMPFTGGSRVITEILGDHVDAGVLKPSEILTQVKAKKLRPIGIFNNDGLKELGDVPTFKSLGYDVFTYGNLRQVSFLMGPDGIKAEEKDKLVKMFKEAIESEEFKKFAAQSGMQVKTTSGDELKKDLTDISKSLDKVSKEIWTKK